MTEKKKPDRKKVIPPDVDTARGPGKKTARVGDSVVSKNPDAGLLRRQAEKIARKKPESMEQMSPAEASKLIHELSVHQIELEMQNDELRASEERLEEAREQYFNLYDLAPVAISASAKRGLFWRPTSPGPICWDCCREICAHVSFPA